MNELSVNLEYMFTEAGDDLPSRVRAAAAAGFAKAEMFWTHDKDLDALKAALDEHGAIVGAGDFDAQAEQTFRNLKRVLEAGGSSLENVVKVTIFLKDMANFPKIVELRKRWFSAPYPADTIVEVTSLALPELELEIEAIAVAAESAG